MSLKRTTIIFVSAAALAAWFAAAMTPARPPVPRLTSTSEPIDTTGAALASEIARLRERLRPEPAPRGPIRNPFRFRTAPGPSAPTPAVDLPVAPILENEVLRPSLRLAGIAEDPAPEGTVRTAVISGGGQLFLAKQGDTVADRGITYRVEQIFEESVELTDLRDGAMLRLTLK
jgi:hypothetical protein